MPAYDAAGFQPPAPVAQVTLRNPASGAVQAGVPVLLDTGADVSLVPLQLARQIGASPIPGRQYQLVGFDGSISMAPVVQLEMIFCGRTFRGQFLLIDQDRGILGRNVLNGVSLLFDGPQLQWDEHRDRTP